MKEIEVIINGDKLERVKRILSAFSKSGIFVTQGFGYGHQQGFHQVYTRDDNRGVNMLPKVSVRTVVPDELVDPIVDEMVADMGNATFGDGKIFEATPLCRGRGSRRSASAGMAANAASAGMVANGRGAASGQGAAKSAGAGEAASGFRGPWPLLFFVAPRRRRLSAASYPLLAVSAVARLPPLPSRRIHLLLAVRTRSQP